MNIKPVIAFVMIAALLVAGCANTPKLSEADATKAAEAFVTEHVRFFSKNGSSNVSLATYNFTSSVIREKEGVFTILLHVTATLDNDTKANDLRALVDSKTGKVTEFNGQRIS